MLEPIVKTIEVPCSQEKAFGVFVNEMGSWWPMETFSASAMGGGTAKSLTVDPKPGGRIVETTPEDIEHLWGIIRSYDPNDLLTMDFHLDPSNPEPVDFTLVEVRFTALGDDRTQVVLTQSNWEALGDMGPVVHGGYGQGWTMIFEQAFKAACGG